MKRRFDSILRPITKDFVFFFCIIAMLVHRAFFNLGLEVFQDWSNYPILKIVVSAVLLAYVLTIVTSFKYIGKYIKIFVYGIIVALITINIFLKINFDNIISSNVILLITETNKTECEDFVSTNFFSAGTAAAFIFAVFMMFFLCFLEKRKHKLLGLIRKYATGNFKNFL